MYQYLFILLSLFSASVAAQSKQIHLSGTLSGDDQQTFIAVPFEVPANIKQLDVVFSYDNSERTVIDIGLRDPERIRGYSGGSKKSFSVSAIAATPSYLAGPIIPGQWQLLLGVPNIRKKSTNEYTAIITLHEEIPEPSTVLNKSKQWYRGDLHAHSGQSDGWCMSKKQSKVPCPMALGVGRAQKQGLDFIAFTEHNTRAGYQDVMRLQPYNDDILMLAGREVTTFFGHANVLGTAKEIDFRIENPDFSAIQQQLPDDSVTIINHPNLPSGEVCMGCGWQATADYSKVDAIEVANGATLNKVGAAGLATKLWHSLLNQGYKIAAVAGSDNHNPIQLNRTWRVSTAIAADELSVPTLLKGIKQGRTFIDLQNTAPTEFTFSVKQGEQLAHMGETLTLDGGNEVKVALETDIEGAYWQVITDSQNKSLRGSSTSASLTLAKNDRWLRCVFFDVKDQPLLVSSPIYINQ